MAPALAIPALAQERTILLSDVGTAEPGFRVDGIDPDDHAGFSVNAAGDVNGDGLGDVIVSAWYADPGGRDRAGESYVVFGKTDGSAVDLATLDSGGGFRIDGIDAVDLSGHWVAGGEDINGDGLDDLVIGAVAADPFP